METVADSENDSDVEALLVSSDDDSWEPEPQIKKAEPQTKKAKRSQESKRQEIQLQLANIRQKEKLKQEEKRMMQEKKLGLDMGSSSPPFSLVSRATGDKVPVKIGPASVMRRRRQLEADQKRRTDAAAAAAKHRQNTENLGPPKLLPAGAIVTEFRTLNLTSTPSPLSEPVRPLSLKPFRSTAYVEEVIELDDSDNEEGLENVDSNSKGEKLSIAGVIDLDNMPVIDVSGLFGPGGPTTSSSSVAAAAESHKEDHPYLQQSTDLLESYVVNDETSFVTPTDPMPSTSSSSSSATALIDLSKEVAALRKEQKESYFQNQVQITHSFPLASSISLQPVPRPRPSTDIIDLSSDDEELGGPPPAVDADGAPITFFRIS